MKSFLYIPFVNGKEFLKRAINSVDQNIHNEYIIFNNSGEHLPESLTEGTNFRVVNYFQRISFIKMSNILRSYAIDNGYDFYLYMHHDSEILDNTHRRLVKAAARLNDNWGIIYTKYDVLCAYRTSCLKKIGEWGDLNWPKEQMVGYYADVDYYARIRKENYIEYNLTDCNIIHFESATIKNSDIEMNNYQKTIQCVKGHLKNKWNLVEEKEIHLQLLEMYPRNIKYIDY